MWKKILLFFCSVQQHMRTGGCGQGGQVGVVRAGSRREHLRPGKAGSCGHGTSAGCRSSPPLLGRRARFSPSSPDCRQSRARSGTPRGRGWAAPGDVCGQVSTGELAVPERTPSTAAVLEELT